MDKGFLGVRDMVHLSLNARNSIGRKTSLHSGMEDSRNNVNDNEETIDSIIEWIICISVAVIVFGMGGTCVYFWKQNNKKSSNPDTNGCNTVYPSHGVTYYKKPQDDYDSDTSIA